MKKTLCLFLLVGCVLGQAAQVPSEWKERYRQVVKTFTTRNFAAFKKLVADEYVWILPDGTTKNRKESLAEFEPLFKAVKATGDEKIEKVEKKGDTVEVTFKANFVFTFADKSKVEINEEGIDTWKKIKGKWQFIQSRDKPKG